MQVTQVLGGESSNTLSVIGIEIAPDDSKRGRIFHMNVSEARRIIQESRGRRFYVLAKHGAPLKNRNGPDVELSSYVEVTRTALLRYIASTYEFPVRDIAYIRVGIFSACVFVG